MIGSVFAVSSEVGFLGSYVDGVLLHSDLKGQSFKFNLLIVICFVADLMFHSDQLMASACGY